MSRFWKSWFRVFAGTLVQLIGIVFWDWDVLTLVSTFFLESLILAIFVYITVHRLKQKMDPDFLSFKIAFPVFFVAQVFFFLVWNFTFGHKVAIPWLARLMMGGDAWIPFVLVGMLTAIRGFYELQFWLQQTQTPQIKLITNPAILRIFVQQFMVIIGGGMIQVLGNQHGYGYLLLAGKLLLDTVGLYQHHNSNNIPKSLRG